MTPARFDSQTLATIRKAAVFSAVGDKTLRGFLGRCEVLELPAGSQIVRPGQSARMFFVVLSGRVKVYMLSARGDEQILHIFGPGEAFGEAAMWAGTGYPAHAQTLSGARLLAIGRDSLRKAISARGDLAMGMLAGMAAKLRQFSELIEQLSLKDVPARLAGVLLYEARKTGSSRFRLRQSKRELAAQIGTVPETLSRALAKMKIQGILDVKGSQITVRDPDALADLAQTG